MADGIHGQKVFALLLQLALAAYAVSQTAEIGFGEKEAKIDAFGQLQKRSIRFALRQRRRRTTTAGAAAGLPPPLHRRRNRRRRRHAALL